MDRQGPRPPEPVQATAPQPSQRPIRDTGASNAAIAIELIGPVRWWPLQEAVNWLVARHRALRSELGLDGTAVRRRVRPADSLNLELDVLAGDPVAIEADLREYARTPFRLDRPPLCRIGLFTLAPDRSVICLAVPRAAVGVASLGALAAELAEGYLEIAEHGEPKPRPEPTDPEPDESAMTIWRRQAGGGSPAAEPVDGGQEAGEVVIPAPERDPRTRTTEAVVADVVRETVGFDIPTEANFFEAGMNSELAVAVYIRLQQELRHEFPVTDLFKYSTRRELAAYLERSRRDHGDG
ncbi:condensation domain-containing protein [Actinoallomurus acanthiterrae]